MRERERERERKKEREKERQREKETEKFIKISVFQFEDKLIVPFFFWNYEKAIQESSGSF